MIKSKLFENEDELNSFLKDNFNATVISVETVTVEVCSELRLPGLLRLKWNEDRLKLWYSTSEQETCPIPTEAHSLEVFAIKDSESSPTGKEAYIGYKLANGDFHFISVPYTENVRSDKK